MHIHRDDLGPAGLAGLLVLLLAPAGSARSQEGEPAAAPGMPAIPAPDPKAAQLPAGAVTAYQYGGGAGFESPLLRDPEAVKEDVLDEYVSLRAARERYGVVFRGSLEDGTLELDLPATRALRERIAAERGRPAACGPAR